MATCVNIQVVKAETVFDYFSLYNQIEFKGQADALTLAGYNLILGRRHLFLGEKECSGKEMTTTIISARQPRNVLYHCQDDVRWETVGAGHYITTDLQPIHLFVSNELVIEPKNYPLLLFAASKQKFRQFLERIVHEENTIYTYYAHFIDYELVEEVLRMAGKQSSYQRNLEQVIQDLLSVANKDDIVKLITTGNLVRGLYFNERLGQLNTEEQKQFRQLLQKLTEGD